MSVISDYYVFIRRDLIALPGGNSLKVVIQVTKDRDLALRAFDEAVIADHASVELYRESLSDDVDREKIAELIDRAYRLPRPQGSTVVRYWSDPDPSHLIHSFERGEVPDDLVHIGATGSSEEEVEVGLRRALAMKMLDLAPWRIRLLVYWRALRRIHSDAPVPIRAFVGFALFCVVYFFVDVFLSLF